MAELSKVETARLDQLEAIVRDGIKSFIVVGTALMEIQEKELYRAEFKTFEDYCRARWNLSRPRAYQLISSVGLVNNLSTMVDKPIAERSIRPLTKLEPKEQQAAYQEAAKKAPDGVPTAKQVQAAVDRRLSHVNGVVSHDPPEIAKARLNGKIPHDAVVTITRPEEPTDVDEIAEEHEEAAAQAQDAVSDEDWADSLPLAGKLTGYQLKVFRSDALAWRALDKARASYLHHARRVIKREDKGEFVYRVTMFLGMDGPEKWNLCTAPKNGGCGGSGSVGPNGLECPKCHRRGYWIMGRKA